LVFLVPDPPQLLISIPGLVVILLGPDFGHSFVENTKSRASEQSGSFRRNQGSSLRSE
jgi:hypothetical protein